MMRVAGTPMKPNVPMLAATERRTIMTPPRPSVILLSIMNIATWHLVIWPRLNVMYTNMIM